MSKKYNIEFQMKEESVLLWLYQNKAIGSIVIKEYELVNLCRIDLKMKANSYRACINRLHKAIEENILSVALGRVVCINGDINERPKHKKKKKKRNHGKYRKSYGRSDFYKTDKWRSLRVKALVKYGRKCCLCGRPASDGVVLHVDHIKPRSKYPALELDINNLQILCEDCNLGKSNKYSEKLR